MTNRNLLFRDTAVVAAGQALCTAVMIGIFALIGRYDLSVLLGGIVGALIAIANFFIMSLFVNLAADKAEAQDVAGGQKLIYMGRMAGLFLVLILCAKSGLFHVLTLVFPLGFTRPILTAATIFKKKGGSHV